MKKLFAYILSILMVLTHTNFTFAYSDIDNNEQFQWAAEDISEFTQMGFLSGYPDGSFRPQNNVTRAELAKLLVTVFGDGETKEYTDVKEDSWYHPFVTKSANYFLTQSDFSPEKPATREEIAYAVYHAAAFEKAEASAKFPDEAEILKDYTEAVKSMAYHGILRGYPDGSFCPQNNVTRAETVALFNRAIKLKETPSEPEVTPSPVPSASPQATPVPSNTPATSNKTNNYFFVVKKVAMAVDEENEPVTKLTGYNEGVLEEVTFKDITVENSDYVSTNAIQAEDIVLFTRDYFGDVRFVSIALRPSELPQIDKIDLLKIGSTTKRKMVSGIVKKRYGERALELLSADQTTTKLYTIGSSANVYILQKSGKLELSAVSEIWDSQYDKGDTIVAYCYDDELKEILIIKE